jgi:hypothetical protein
VIHLFLKAARKVDGAADYVFVQLTEKEPGIYDKRHPDYTRRNKIDLAWERISHEMKESATCVYVYILSCVLMTKYRVRIGNWIY